MSKNDRVTKVRGATYTFPESYLLHENGDHKSSSHGAAAVVLDMTDTQAMYVDHVVVTKNVYFNIFFLL